MVDVRDDFTIDPALIAAAVTPRTKAIIPVDMGGWPADYDAIRAALADAATHVPFEPRNDRQQKLGRVLIVSDAAHSIGSIYKGRPNGQLADASVFSLHSVKNVTTGEGGAICLNLPAPFDNDAELTFLRALSLNGQNKSAFEKNQTGAWRYDIIDQGLKVNMPDINAAIGLAQMRKYVRELLPDRKRIFERYRAGFAGYDWAILPLERDADHESSCHLFLLRVAGADEARRDRIIAAISAEGVGVNVHYIPMAMLTLFRSMGYRIEDYPKTFALYQNEITLPLYNGLTDAQVDEVIRVVVDAVQGTP
jgi:dTDP-4-amino-4,6-dideoxygalactose transaminase